MMTPATGGGQDAMLERLSERGCREPQSLPGCCAGRRGCRRGSIDLGNIDGQSSMADSLLLIEGSGLAATELTPEREGHLLTCAARSRAP
jgi:hypothetical protein